jgi:5-methylcytosine-specific restriction endonuclease McrA
VASEYIPYDGPIVIRADAKLSGLTRFFTGNPCKHGHLSQRTTCNGGCIQCNQISISSLYHTEDAAARKARNTRAKAWKDANREQVKAQGRKYASEHREQSNAWKVANRDKINAAAREAYNRDLEAARAKANKYSATAERKASLQAYYEANKDAVKQRVREWKDANPDRVLELRQIGYEANKEIVKQRVREWNEANPEGARSRGRNYRARKYAAEGSHTGDEIKALYVKQGGLCIYCRTDLQDKYDVDHIQPLARGGSNWISNLQLACKPCNNQKRAIDPIEFERRRAKRLAAKET